MDDFLHKTIGPLVLEKFVISSIIVFFSGWILLLISIFGGRKQKLNWAKKREQNRGELQKMMYSLLFEDFEEEVWQEKIINVRGLKGKKLVWALELSVLLKRQYTGIYGERIVRLFEETGWKQKVFRQFQKTNWNDKSNAIRWLAEMNQVDCYDEIKQELFHSNEMVRDEAAIALIRLKGFRAILDLQQMPGLISDWSQIQIIQALKSQEELAKKWIYPLLNHSNASLKILGRRIIQEMDPEEYVKSNQEQSV